MLITEKSLSDLCAVLLPFSALPFIMSYTGAGHLCAAQDACVLGGGGGTLEQWTEAKAHNITQLMRGGFHRNVVPLACYHLSSQSDMLIRSMSALESPSSARRFNRCLQADGLRGGGARAFRAVSGQRAGNGSGDVSLPLYSACCFHAAAAKAGGGAVPAASCRTLGVAAAEETGSAHESAPVMNTQQWGE